MTLPRENIYTIEDIYNLPEGQRAELMDGQLYMMAPPNRIHQKLSSRFSQRIANYIDSKHSGCEVYAAPFAVFLKNDEQNYVEPDISVICDKKKLDDRGCNGAPDWIIEIISPSSRKIDYSTKMTLYLNAGVREYWIVDYMKERTTVYRYEEDAAPMIFPFNQEITVGIYKDLHIKVTDFLS